MPKKDISTIIKSGTARERVKLLAEQIARDKFVDAGDPILTEKEFFHLEQSFKSDKEIKLYNKFRKADSTITRGITNLDGLKFEILNHYTNLRGYIFLWDNLQSSELLVNSILHGIENREERIKIAENRAVKRSLFNKNVVDKEGYIEIQVDGDKQLLDLIKIVSKDATKSVSKWLGWYKALKEYIDKEGVKIKAYSKVLKSIEETVFFRVVSMDKYYGELDEKLADIDEVSPRILKLLQKYNVCPDPYEIEPDKVAYNWFKSQITRDE